MGLKLLKPRFGKPVGHVFRDGLFDEGVVNTLIAHGAAEIVHELDAEKNGSPNKPRSNPRRGKGPLAGKRKQPGRSNKSSD